MKIKEKQMIKTLNISFGIMFLSVIVLLVFGEIFMPVENPTESGESVLLEADWERVFSDGTREQIEVPGQCDVERGDVLRLETTLPQEQSNTWFCMRASQQNMRVWVGDELRKEYSTEETRLFGKNSASAFVFFEIGEEDAGKILAIEIISDSEYAGFLNEIYVGDKYDIVNTFVRQCFEVIFISVCMFLLSLITVLIGCILRFIYKIRVDITYLGIAILQLSLAMISESRIRQFFLPNSSIAAHVGFLLTILIPYPFLYYVNRIQKGRYEGIYRVLSVSVLINFVVSVVLQLLDILDLADSMIASYVIIIIMVLAIAVTIILDIKRGYLEEYGEIAFGLIAMIIVSIWETYITFVPISPLYGGVALSIGLIILLITAGFKTARDMIALEQEKQIAIAAGDAKAKFIANMSHEIRTPINTIIGMNEMILRENHDDSVEEYAKNVQNASKLLLGLINDILDFSKIEAGKMDILEADYYLSKMLVDVIAGVQLKAESKKLEVLVHIEESLPSVLRGDEIKIRQIINNLLSNAVKYTKQGTITLAVKGIRNQENFVLCLSVEDSGIGIKPEDLDKLFDSFQRLEEKKNRYIEGTGLGLNITKQLVELMGGSIAVKSEYGKGSCFTVQVPQQIKDATVIGKLEDAYKRDLSVKADLETVIYAPTAEILVVDDNEMNLAVVKALLKRTGIKLTLALGGMECLELCRDNKYDLILMDHMMPEPDGIETLHILREDEHSLNRNTDVIVLTANAIASAAEKYMQEGFVDYLSKPIVVEKLEGMLLKYIPDDKLEVKADISIEDIASYIDKKVAMEYCANSEEMYQEMVDAYCLQGQKNLQKLSEYYEAHDWENYRIIVHAIKSTSLVIGAVALSEKAKVLENAAKEKNEEILLKEAEGLYQEYETIIRLIK